jgi:hypothetical protein
LDKVSLEYSSNHTDSSITVNQTSFLEFAPIAVVPSIGFIFYPWGTGWITILMRQKFTKLQKVVSVVPMPFNLAIFGVNSADEVIAAHPEIQNWEIGGHSQLGWYGDQTGDKLATVTREDQQV